MEFLQNQVIQFVIGAIIAIIAIIVAVIIYRKQQQQKRLSYTILYKASLLDVKEGIKEDVEIFTKANQ